MIAYILYGIAGFCGLAGLLEIKDPIRLISFWMVALIFGIFGAVAQFM
jgi:hypothetical protein